MYQANFSILYILFCTKLSPYITIFNSLSRRLCLQGDEFSVLENLLKARELISLKREKGARTLWLMDLLSSLVNHFVLLSFNFDKWGKFLNINY